MSRVDKIGLAPQGAWGTKETVMTDFVPVATAAASPNRETLQMDETLGSRAASPLEYGTSFHQVGMELAPRPSSLGRILTSFKGLPATVAGAGPDVGSFVHSWSDPNAEAIPHSILRVLEDPSPAIVDLFWDTIGNDYELSVAANDFLRIKPNWIGRALDQDQPVPVAAMDITKRWNFKQVVVYVSLNGAGETAIACRDFSANETNNVETDDAVLGSNMLFSLPEGNLDSTIKFAPRQTLSAYYKEALKADPTTTKVRMVATGGLIPGTTKHFTLEQIAYCVEFTDAPADADASQVLRAIEMSGRVYQDPASGKVIETKLTNATASYA
ncbi:MAG: hypothetical protein ACJ76I_11865 [Gaiellaceae bacterium]